MTQPSAKFHIRRPSPEQATGHIDKVWLFAFLLMAFLFLYLRTFLLLATPLVASGDEALHFDHAVRMVHGQVPFRDFFIFVMPGTDLLYAGLFREFGVHAWLAQVILIVLGFTITCLVIWISQAILSGLTALLPGLLFLVLDFNSARDATHHWYSTLFAMAAIATLLGSRSIPRVLVAGALCGIATVFTQTQGTLSLIAIGLYLAITAREKKPGVRLSTQLVALVLPFVLIVASVLGYYAHQAGYKSVFFALGYFAFKFFSAEEANTLRAYFFQIPRLHGLGDLLSLAPFIFVHLLVPFAYLACLLRLFREKESLDRQLWEDLLLINLVGLALFAAVMTGPTYHRLCMVTPPAIIVCVWFFSGTRIVDRTVRGLLWSIAVILALYLPVNLQLHWRAYLDLPTGRTAFLDPIQYEQFRWFAQQTRAGESFFSHPVLSFALSLDNPTPLDYVTPNEFTRPEQVDATIRSLAGHQTPLIFLYPQLYAPHQPGDNLGPLRQYVYQNYHLVKVYPSGQVWERN